MSETAEVTAVVKAAPGLTAGEIRDLLRARGRGSITAADVARILAGSPRRFQATGDPPRWWTAGDTSGSVSPPLPAPPTRPLHDWQAEALAAWRGRGRRGVVEAVTGTGKTIVGVAAALEELALGGQVCVIVPTRELLGQWAAVLAELLPSNRRLGLLGGGHHQSLGQVDVLLAVANSARDTDLYPRRPGGLLVADECHRYGSDLNRLCLDDRFPHRLGLSATYGRADDGHLAWLDPYFGGRCFRMGYDRAIADGVTARFDVALLGVRFAPDEADQYTELSVELSRSRARLIARGVPAEPVGEFLAAVARLARRGDTDDRSATARAYLRAMQERRRLLAETPAKTAALRALAPAIADGDRAIVFTQSIVAAERAAVVLGEEGLAAAATHSGLEPRARAAVLTQFGAGTLQVVCAPQVLDEGVDVPAADLAVVLAANHSRRQMIQRLGRVLRRKPDGRRARLVVVFVEATVEDPARGAHATFIDEMTAAADHVTTFTPDVDPSTVRTYLTPASAPAASVPM